jgi:acetoin utilization deacetylase AcuC-like enzyme
LIRAWASDHFEVPLPEGHPFPLKKYRALRELLVAEGVVVVTLSEEAPRAWLEAAHDPKYVSRVLHGELSAEEVRRFGMPWSLEVVTRARAAVFGTVRAAEAALTDGIAGNLAGGTHHAFYDRGEGYCLFNDVAVALGVLGSRVARPFIVDLDVHQGNGTAAMFAGDERVFTFSMHARTNYPLRKERSSLDVELEDGTDDATYLGLLDDHLERALDGHKPDFVFYQAGVDALHADRLGRLGLTHEGLKARDARVFGWCSKRGLPVCVTLGGGYGRPLEATVEAHANVFRYARPRS